MESTLPKIYLHTNGVTLVARSSAVVGQSYTYNGTSYMVVDDSNISAQVAADNFNLVTTRVTSMYRMFRNDGSFNTNIGFWDTSSVTNMDQMFVNASSFNQNISSWDVSNVTNMNSAFQNSAFKQNIVSSDVSRVTM